MRTIIGGKLVWTRDHVEALRAGVVAGKAADVIGEEMGRSTLSIQKQARALGLKLPSKSAGHPAGWSDERVELLKKLWADPMLSATVIGARLGLTRNAVLGKVNRLGLPPRAIGAKRKMPGHKPDKIFPGIVMQTSPPPPPRVEDVPRVSTMELEVKHCRWPCVADPALVSPHAPQFCGLPAVLGQPYCRGHLARAYVPLRPRRALTPPSNYALLVTSQTGRVLAPSSS